MALDVFWKLSAIMWKGLQRAKTIVSRSLPFRSMNSYKGLSLIVLFYFLMAIVSLTSNGNHNHQFDDIPMITSTVAPVLKGREEAQLTTTTNASPKIILFWTPYYKQKDYTIGFGKEPFVKSGCKVQNCVMTTDRGLRKQSDAVVFHGLHFSSSDLPKQRTPDQRFIFYLYDTNRQIRSLLPAKEFKTASNYFNWTMTQRRDSDIYISHGAFIHKTETLNDEFPSNHLPVDSTAIDQTYSHLANRTRLVAGFNSHCPTDAERVDYVKELAQLVQVDIYGICGTTNCLPRNSSRCNHLFDSYKFYLVEENSDCPDTKNFYKALMNDVIPIVYGDADYTEYAPPHSFINIADFKSPKALANYLTLLDENDTLYMEYFQWKNHYMLIRSPMTGWCDLCAKLNDPNQQTQKKSYVDVADWWIRKQPIEQLC